MKTAIAIVLFVAACGGSKPKPAAKPVVVEKPEVKEPEPEPEPPPPPAPTYPAWYADADYSVVLSDDGSASIENKKKKAKPIAGTWDGTVNTLTIKEQASPIKLDGENLVMTLASGERTLQRQPAGFKGETYEYKKSEKDFGSLQLKEDGTCVLGTKGMPSPCTFKLEAGKLTITEDSKPKKPQTWVVWFEENGKTMHTPKQTYTVIAGESE